MGIIATENFRFSNTVKHEYEPSIGFCRGVVVFNGAAGELKIGTVLSKQVDGKYAIAAPGDTDVVVVIEDKVAAAATDLKIMCLVRGAAIVSKPALILAAAFDTQPEKDAIYAALEAKNILVNDAV